MQWQQVRANYPNQWLIVEALDAHTDNAQRYLEQLAVIESCQDSKTAFNHYHEWHKNYPEREFYFLHTSKEQLAIVERQWLASANFFQKTAGCLQDTPLEREPQGDYEQRLEPL